MIIEIPNALEIDEINNIRNAVKPFLKDSRSTTFYRDGKTVCISEIPELEKINNYLYNLFVEIQAKVIKQRYQPVFLSADSGYEYHIYDSQEICNYHGDGEFDHNGSEIRIRYASVTLHLNTIKEGGELIFPNQNKKVKTEAGKIVIFPPYNMFGHYTTPSEEPREIIVTWFLYRGIKAIEV